MIENYNKIDQGHWHQIELTGDIMKYDENYMQYYTSMDNRMSKLRYDLIYKNIGSFKSVLDVGYGDGNFLQYCFNHDKECYGNDISNYPLPQGINFVEDASSLKFDVITFFDSLEHRPEPDLLPFLKSLKTDYLVVSLPWCHEFMGPSYFKEWKHRKPNEHFHHFDYYGLINLFDNAGFKTIHMCNAEDEIRKPVNYLPNILTIIAKKYE
jgi:SAM-dependent methyltransferase